MHGEMKADFTAMPVANIITLFVCIAILLVIAAVIIVIVARKLNIKNFGPFKTEHDNMSTLYNMNDKIKDIDDSCHRQMRYITDRMKIHIANIFTEISICTPSKIAISSAIRFPLFESISNNHFTTELMPDRFAFYRERIIEVMKEEYISLATVNKDDKCNRDKLPPWSQMGDLLTGCIDLWLKKIAREVMYACEKK